MSHRGAATGQRSCAPRPPRGRSRPRRQLCRHRWGQRRLAQTGRTGPGLALATTLPRVVPTPVRRTTPPQIPRRTEPNGVYRPRRRPACSVSARRHLSSVHPAQSAARPAHPGPPRTYAHARPTCPEPPTATAPATRRIAPTHRRPTAIDIREVTYTAVPIMATRVRCHVACRAGMPRQRPANRYTGQWRARLPAGSPVLGRR